MTVSRAGKRKLLFLYSQLVSKSETVNSVIPVSRMLRNCLIIRDVRVSKSEIVTKTRLASELSPKKCNLDKLSQNVTIDVSQKLIFHFSFLRKSETHITHSSFLAGTGTWKRLY